jgi:urate oxidase
MKIALGENRYGKSRVRLIKVTRADGSHNIVEWTVEVWLTGDFASCFMGGDNSHILPTDTMKNTVYSLARSSSATSMEDFASELAAHFLENNPHAESAEIRIQGRPWKHIAAGGEAFPTAFTHAADRLDTTTVTFSRSNGLAVASGFDGLWLLKTAQSGFSGYIKDRLTTLKETDDRLLGTLASAKWRYAGEHLNFAALRERAQTSLLRAFAAHHSRSVQETLYAMAEAALEAVPEMIEIDLSMPNKHCNLVDLSPFGQDNPNMIFVPTDEPHGSIEACVRRAE